MLPIEDVKEMKKHNRGNIYGLSHREIMRITG